MSEERGSIVFDRAAEYYDKTRSRPPDVAERENELLAAELAGRGPCLEPGVGTGRVALPLHERGIDVVGLDLSRPMMDQLVAKSGGRPPFPLLQGDATRLPFAAASFGSAVVTHVLHLISNWQDAVDEFLRVVRPGGLLVINIGGWQGVSLEIGAHLQTLLGKQSRRPGVTDAAELDACLAGRTAPPRVVEVAHPEERTPGEVIDRFASGRFSWTWDLDPADLARAAEEARAWATERWGSLDTRLKDTFIDAWRLYELP